jgi:hypothetical protein
MITDEIKYSIKEAIEELSIAEHELNRPNDDIVAMSVCLSAKISMNAFLRMYLLSKANKHTQGKSLADLLKKCAEIDKQFESISLEKVFCNTLEPHECDNKYCLSTHTVRECINTANKVKEIVLKNLQLTEAELAK